MITLEQLHAILANAGPRASVFLAPLNDAMVEFSIDTPPRAAAFLAQLAHESGGLRYVAELASGKAYDGRADLGNTRPEAIRIATMNGSSPGTFWKGHGLIQITGYDNHRACGEALGIDCVNNPHLLELPVYAARSAAWFWWSHDLNGIADAGDFRKITRVINGGFNGYKERLGFFERAKEVLR